MRKAFRGKAIVVAMIAAAGISGCAGTRTSLPTAEELSAAGILPKEADVDALRRGRSIFVTECAACHRLYWPDEYAPEQWHGIVKKMAGRASLSGSQASELDLYLSVASRVKR